MISSENFAALLDLPLYSWLSADEVLTYQGTVVNIYYRLNHWNHPKALTRYLEVSTARRWSVLLVIYTSNCQ